MNQVLVAVILYASATAVFANPGQTPPEDTPARWSREFSERVQSYVTLQKALEAKLPTVKTTADVSQLAASQQALAASLVAARRESHLGDNQIYPEEFPVTTMPPTLLRRLPILPAELVYRIIGRSLVLQDIKTNLIVDVLPKAIPESGR